MDSQFTLGMLAEKLKLSSGYLSVLFKNFWNPFSRLFIATAEWKS